MKKLFSILVLMFICVSVFCQTAMPDYTDLAVGLIAKYPFITYILGVLWLLSEILGKTKYTKANGVIQLIMIPFFKVKKVLFGDTGGSKPPIV